MIDDKFRISFQINHVFTELIMGIFKLTIQHNLMILIVYIVTWYIK